MILTVIVVTVVIIATVSTAGITDTVGVMLIVSHSLMLLVLLQ